MLDHASLVDMSVPEITLPVNYLFGTGAPLMCCESAPDRNLL
jgi:hypothetical protein